MGAKRIFLVDDDVMLCELLKDHLNQKIRHDIHVFHTGEEALKQLHLEPQVVILNYELNAVITDAEDGLHILEKIKDFDKNICVIMLSSQTHYGKAAQTIVKGALEYVVKDNDAFNHIDKILAGL